MLQCPSALFLILIVREKIDQMWVCHLLHSISLSQGLRQCLSTYCLRLLGTKEPWKLEPFPLFVAHAWTDSLIRILILNLPENTKILCTQNPLKTPPGLSPPHTFGFSLAPYIHRRATPFPCLAFPTHSVVPPRMTPHTHQSGWTRCPRIFVARSLLDTQGWFFRRGTSLSDCSESNQGGRPGVLRLQSGWKYLVLQLNI